MLPPPSSPIDRHPLSVPPETTAVLRITPETHTYLTTGCLAALQINFQL